MIEQTCAAVGCWSYSKSEDGAVETMKIMDCALCLCRADVDDCAQMNFLEQDCKICVSDVAAIGDGEHECVFGIDEADDARVIKDFFPEDFLRLAMNGGRWRCEDPLNGDRVKHCGSVLPQHRRPFLFSVPKAGQRCENVEGKAGLEFRFWECSDGSCVRDLHQCDGECPRGLRLDEVSGLCQDVGCPGNMWDCEGNCIGKQESCNRKCFRYESEYSCYYSDDRCIPFSQPCGPSKVCPMDHLYCDATETCVPDAEPCGGTCLAKRRHFCYSSNSCLYGHQFCSQRCRRGQHYCRDECQDMARPCQGKCARGWWICQRESVSECLPDGSSCGGTCKESFRRCGDVCQPSWAHCAYSSSTTAADDGKTNEDTEGQEISPRPREFRYDDDYGDFDICRPGEQLCHNVNDLDSVPQCIPRDSPCNRICLDDGMSYCKSLRSCFRHGEFDETCPATVTSKLVKDMTWMGIGIAITATVLLAIAVIYRATKPPPVKGKKEAEEGGRDNNGSTDL